MTGYQWGSQPMWMYQCTCNLQENTEWVSSRILPYGAVFDLGWADQSLLVPVQKAKVRFGRAPKPPRSMLRTSRPIGSR